MLHLIWQAALLLMLLTVCRLPGLRPGHNLTREQAAERVGVNRRLYQLLEAGRKKLVWLDG